MRGQVGTEWRKHVLSKQVPDQIAFIELRADRARDLRMRCGELAPMKSWLIVVHRVKAVIEEQEIEHFAGEVARMIVH